MRLRKLTVAVLVCCIPCAAYSEPASMSTSMPAGDLCTPVQIDGETILIPTPEGFRAVSMLSTKVQKSFAVVSLAVNQSLAAYVSEEDINRSLNGEQPQHVRVMAAAKAPSIKEAFSADEFAEMAAQCRRNPATLLAGFKEGLADSLKEGLACLPTSVKVDLDDAAPMELFIDTKDAIGFFHLVKCQLTFNEHQKNLAVGGAYLILRIKGKVLMAVAIITSGSAEDIAWAKAATTGWVGQFQAVNATRKAVVLGWPAVGVIVGIVLVVFVLASRFRRWIERFDPDTIQPPAGAPP